LQLAHCFCQFATGTCLGQFATGGIKRPGWPWAGNNNIKIFNWQGKVYGLIKSLITNTLIVIPHYVKINLDYYANAKNSGIESVSI
jgi:hypothetical protein